MRGSQQRVRMVAVWNSARSLFITLVILSIACGVPDGVISPPHEINKIGSQPSMPIDATAIDSLAAAVAISLSSVALRGQLLEDLRDSPFPFNALHFQSYIAGAKGSPLATAIARQLGILPPELNHYLARFPDLTLALDRTLDRVTWKSGEPLVVYASTSQLTERIKTGPMATGFDATGQSVSVPIWEAGSGHYLSLVPSDIDFGPDPEARRSAAPPQNRATVSTRERERDATRRGATLRTTILPCDPEFSCSGSGGYESDGISLPTPYTAAYCFGWTNWPGIEPLDASNDTDADGIRQDCEYQLAYAFSPQVARNSDDHAPEREPYWSVARIDGTVTGVRIFYALSYYRDAGFHETGTGAHPGDSEFIILELHNNMNPNNDRLWSLQYATLSAHWNSGYYDNTATYAAADLGYPSIYRGYPRIWASWDKHANYRSASVCNGVWNSFDVCTTLFTHTVYDRTEVLANANLGNQNNTNPPITAHRLVNCVTSRRYPTLYFGTECYWEGTFFFAGWTAEFDPQPATAYYNMLYYYQF